MPDTDLDIESGEVVWAYRPPTGTDEVSNEEAEVRRTATLTIGETDLDVESYLYRPWIEMQSWNGAWVRFNEGVLVSTNPPVNDDGRVIRRTLKLADKTFRYRRELENTIVVPAATNPVTYIQADLTSRFGETSFALPSTTVTLATAMVFSPPMTWLAVYNKLLQVAALDALTCDEDLGRPRSVALSALAGQGPEWEYGPGAGKVVTAGAVEPLIERTPNVVRFVARQGPSLAAEGNGIKTVKNQSTGPASIDQRGEEIPLRVDVTAENQTQLEQIAAAEAQRYFAGGGLRFTGQVGLNPLHGDRDVVELNKPRLGLSGTWLCTEWRLPLQRKTAPSAALMNVTFEKRI